VPDRVEAFAPGRVNLIGEHTDYNEGLALPFAISAGVVVRARRGPDNEVHIHAGDLDADAHDTFPLHDPPRAEGWRAFGRGVVAELSAAGVQLRGARLEVEGTVPRGSGLSSSAALEVSLCLALLGVADAAAPDRLDLARICSRVENEWVGAQTGMLDQIASLCGERDHAVSIDFRDLTVDRVPLELGEYMLVVLDSGQRHRLGGGGDDSGGGGDDSGEHPEQGYNQRREECGRACELLEVASLRDATVEDAQRLPAPLGDRVRHVLLENERVRATIAALAQGDLDRVGELLDESHASLRDLYAVSTPAVEEAISVLRRAGAIGARIVGGGFGGHVLGLLPPGTELPEGATRVVPGPGAQLR
jgi:galactokinase